MEETLNGETVTSPAQTPPGSDSQFAPQDSTGPLSPPPPGPKKLPVVGILTGAVILLALVVGIITAQKAQFFSPRPAVTPTPPSLPLSPTPEKQLSVIASQSAFIQIEANVASLSGSIQNIIVSDPSLSPPVLDLPLGFSN